jgi:hypothetical protein
MGHDPFEHHLSYAPVRQFSSTGSDNQIYDEMYTGDWWWRTQSEIPDGGTIVRGFRPPYLFRLSPVVA